MGIIAVLIYGIMACLSTLYPTVGSMWVGAVWLVLLGMAIAAVVGLLVGFLVMPSLASDEVRCNTALLGCGRVAPALVLGAPSMWCPYRGCVNLSPAAASCHSRSLC